MIKAGDYVQLVDRRNETAILKMGADHRVSHIEGALAFLHTNYGVLSYPLSWFWVSE